MTVQWGVGISSSLLTKAKSRSPDERSDIRGHSHTAYSTVIAREGGRSSIPEAAVIEPISRGVLDTPPSRGMTVQWRVGISSSLLTKRSLVARMSAATSGATLTLHIPPSSPAKGGVQAPDSPTRGQSCPDERQGLPRIQHLTRRSRGTSARRSRGVLDTPPSRGMTVQWRVGISSSLLTKRSLVARMSAATSGATLTPPRMSLRSSGLRSARAVGLDELSQNPPAEQRRIRRRCKLGRPAGQFLQSIAVHHDPTPAFVRPAPAARASLT